MVGTGGDIGVFHTVHDTQLRPLTEVHTRDCLFIEYPIHTPPLFLKPYY